MNALDEVLKKRKKYFKKNVTKRVGLTLENSLKVRLMFIP
jgi:hypothetical protein